MLSYTKPLSRLSVFAFLITAALTPPAIADSSISVDPYHPQQVIQGFGASDAWIAGNLRYFYTAAQDKQILDLLFSTSNGAGLSMLRHRIPTEIEPAPGVWDWTQDNYTIWLDQQARLRGVNTVWSTPWTPPAWMKTNDDVNNGGALAPAHYQDYADYLATYVKQYSRLFGVNIQAISLQNEPDITAYYESCNWTGQQFHDFLLNNLIPTFKRDGVTARVIMPEISNWNDGLAAESLADPNTADFLGAVATHDYGGPPNGPFTDGVARGKETWETETSNLGANDPSIVDGVAWAVRLHTDLVVGGAGAWHYWWLFNNDPTGQGLIFLDTADGTYSVNKRLWTIGNFSRFVRPGFRMVPLTSNNPEPNVYTSAFVRVNTGALVVVAINQSNTATNLTVNVPDSAKPTVLAWRTSATEDLKEVTEPSLVNGAFTATLPPDSVTTFTGKVTPGYIAPPIQVEAGGGPTGPFVADTDFTGGNGYTSPNPVEISGVVNPAPASLYQSQRYGQFQYIFSGLTPGKHYTARLHFAETYWTLPGERLFNVLINRDIVLQDFDVFAAAGGTNRALVEQFQTGADPFGNVTITFTNGSADNAMVSGIEILDPTAP